MEREYLIQDLSLKDLSEISGGFILETLALTIGIVAGLAYCYEFGYNYAKERLEKAN
jgi:hypothetical protein